MDETHAQRIEAMDNELLTKLNLEVQEMINTLNVKGTTTFSESAQTGKLRASVIALIADLQFYKVLPSNLHIADGTVIKHL